MVGILVMDSPRHSLGREQAKLRTGEANPDFRQTPMIYPLGPGNFRVPNENKSWLLQNPLGLATRNYSFGAFRDRPLEIMLVILCISFQNVKYQHREKKKKNECHVLRMAVGQAIMETIHLTPECLHFNTCNSR
jgi:hypothetical protein